MSMPARSPQHSGPVSLEEIPSGRRVAGFVKHWWFAIAAILGAGGTLVGTVKTVEAHEPRIARLEAMMIGVAINSAIACGNQPGCVSYEAMATGKLPELQLGIIEKMKGKVTP